MKMKHTFSIKNILIIIFALSSLYYISCANQVAPTGGAKDVSSPAVLQSEPADKSVSFQGDKIVLKFDEYVRLKNVKNEILISPFMKEKPTFKVKGKSLEIKFAEEELQPNMTYTINFGNSIVDITEGNVMKNFQYAFSTGDQIDSLTLKGTVRAAKDNKAAEDIVVALYNAEPDSLVTTTPPRYIARTDEEGTYQINYIGAGSYRLVALLDQNSNYYFDQPNEEIAFYSDIIQLDTDSSAAKRYDLYLFNEGNEPLKAMERNNREYGHLEIIFSKPIDSLNITPLDSIWQQQELLIEKTEKNDTIDIWYKDITPKVLRFAVQDNEDYIDTLQFKGLITEKENLREQQYLTNIAINKVTSRMDLKSPLWLEITHPLKRFDITMVELTKDSEQIDLTEYIKKDPNNPKRLIINYPWKAGGEYNLYLPDSTVTDYFDRPNYEIDLDFKVFEPREYATLMLQCGNFKKETNYILQLFNTRNKLIRELALTDSTTTIPFLKPQKYLIVVIEDTNKNAKWDPGNWQEKRQPEVIYSAKEPIELRANWDTEAKMDLKR